MYTVKEKYGIPVSGRVDVSIAKKLKEEANRLGYTMSKTVHMALSEWANDDERRLYSKQLDSENEQLKAELDSLKATIEEWKEFHPAKIKEVNNIWRNGISKFIHSLSDNGKKLQEYTKTFNKIFKNE